MEADFHQKLRARFGQAQKVLVVSHVRPDGDAIGALLAMGLGLQGAGKQVEMVLSDGVPASFRHLAGADQVLKKATQPADLVVTVDCSDLKRTGSALEGYAKPQINIDHHVTNDGFGELNFIDPHAVATCEIISEYFEAWGFSFTVDIANALMAGIVADTLGFRTSNMRPSALRHAADLMERGADLPEQYSRALLRRSLPAARYWGAGLSSLKSEGGLVYGTLQLSDRKDCDYPGNDDADLINILSAIDGFEIAMIYVEQNNGTVKISWRSVPGIDVSQIAARFGGGGHAAAAGADIPGTLEEIQAQTLATTIQFLEMKHKNG